MRTRCAVRHDVEVIVKLLKGLIWGAQGTSSKNSSEVKSTERELTSKCQSRKVVDKVWGWGLRGGILHGVWTKDVSSADETAFHVEGGDSSEGRRCRGRGGKRTANNRYGSSSRVAR